MVLLVSVLVPLALCAEPAFASKMVAITFDDGPSHNTAKVVDILRSHEASATFFFVGRRMTKGAFDAESLLSVGEIANHTWRHSKSHPWTRYTYSQAKKEIEDTNARIRSHTGQDRIWFRSLGLARPSAVKRAITATKVKFVGGVLVSDWGKGSGNKSAAIKKRVKANAAKNHTVLILHETNSETVKALPGILDWYQSRGYQVVTVSKLMDSK
jgi:peptidoglycan/xylan/chitin deacetylase (PgdA/CDA1 family)